MDMSTTTIHSVLTNIALHDIVFRQHEKRGSEIDPHLTINNLASREGESPKSKRHSERNGVKSRNLMENNEISRFTIVHSI